MSQRNEWRVFCAVELPAEVRARLDDHVRRLRKEVPDAAASWSRVENIHLTLKFFGNVEVQRIENISAAAERVVKEFSSFQIGVGETGVFPRASRPQVLWIGISDPSGQLTALQKRFEDECATIGFPKEDRAYRPHLTIARLRKPEGARSLAETHLKMKFEPSEIDLKELVLFRSELSPKGSKYTVISAADLRG
ncbi:MAG TPA: RNA 2',3'-cyclic phosphodiesterase [Pyrinomonadaceae bacterium]|nr:RNA 2',3'-cyclic phosphodiesterase [Pyrinomonadaceae bacterium]